MPSILDKYAGPNLGLPIGFLCAVFAFQTNVHAQKKKEAIKKQTVLKVSPETTFVLGPLDEEGFIDYAEAANQRFAKVTPENNYEVVVRKLMPMNHVGEDIRKEYYRRLGIDIPDNKDQVDFRASFRKHVPNQIEGKHNNLFDHVLENGWTAEDFPQVAKWLELEKDRLDALVAASKRNHNYTPYIAPELDEPAPPLMMVALASAQHQRGIARALLIRINGQIAKGDLDAAWSDTMGLMRIARQTGSGLTVVELLIACAIDGLAFEPAVQILNSDGLTDAQVAQMLADLTSLKQLPLMAEKINIGERFLGLDVVQVMAREKDLFKAIALIQNLSLFPSPTKATTLVLQNDQPAPAAKPELTKLLDWNATTKVMNKWYDRLVDAASEQDYIKRKAKTSALDADFNKLNVDAGGLSGLLSRVSASKDRSEMGAAMGEFLVSLLVPAVSKATDAQFEAAERLDVLRLSFAAEAYKRQKGQYPERLSVLVPDFVTAIPPDRFAPEPLQYRSSIHGFVLYSLGRNCKNDLGRSRNDAKSRQDATWDDVVVRVK